MRCRCRLSGILNLALAGLHRLAERERFAPTTQMKAELDRYRREYNHLAVWGLSVLVLAAEWGINFDDDVMKFFKWSVVQ